MVWWKSAEKPPVGPKADSKLPGQPTEGRPLPPFFGILLGGSRSDDLDQLVLHLYNEHPISW